MPKKILITGGAGFIGHHVIDVILDRTDWNIVTIDRIDKTSTLERLSAFPKDRLKVIWHDLKSPINDFITAAIGAVDYTIHMAASTHVDRSIVNPWEFVQDNIHGTFHWLEWLRRIDEAVPSKAIYFSTDEVFGNAQPGFAYKEWDRYKCRNPYAATKAGAEELCVAYENTYKVPVYTTHTMNVFGERQHKEKFIPLCISRILAGEEIQIHANRACTKAGSRFYIYAGNVAEALLFLLENGESGEKYNIVGERELTNLELAKLIAQILGKELKYMLVDFHSSRPGHDLRYALDGSKLEYMGFKYPKNLQSSLRQTVEWYVRHPEFLA